MDDCHYFSLLDETQQKQNGRDAVKMLTTIKYVEILNDDDNGE